MAMQRVNLHARPFIIQVGHPTCCYQVCERDHAKVGNADLDYPSERCRRNASLDPNMCGFPYTYRVLSSPSDTKL